MIDLAEELYKFNPWWEGSFEPNLISRPLYTDFLQKNLNNKDIILITGLRRVGKTSLLRLFISDLLKTIEDKFVFYSSLDSLLLENYLIAEILREYRKIHHLPVTEKLYLFLDEVAYRKNIHQELKNLYDRENVKIFASSSSTSIYRDTRAFLTGRSRTLEILPLDFAEFLTFKGYQIKAGEKYLFESYFEQYMKMGGIPEYILTNDVSYIDNLIENIIYKDIVVYYGVRDLSGIKDLFRLLMERAGKQISINKIARTIGKSPDTVRRFVDYFVQTFLVYTIERCGKLNERIRAPKKIYAADAGIRNHITGYRDEGAVFENLIYLRIKQKNPCYIYQNGLELDFYFEDTLLEAKFGRELEGKQKSFYEKYPAHKKICVKGVDDYLCL
ncbi:MAG: ATP-binding protein [bacterium]